MYNFSNLPTKTRPEIEGIPEKDNFRIQTTEGCIICEISRTTEAQTARDIADAITFARDIGYRQALADIRRQLGIDK